MKKFVKRLQFILVSAVTILALVLFGVLVIYLAYGYIWENDDNITYSNNYEEIENFGREEYECYGSCYCEEEDFRRRSAGSVRVGLRYVVAAFTSLVAMDQARKYFGGECMMNYEEFCDDPSMVRSEVDECVHTSDSNERDGVKTDFSCKDNCGEEVRGGDDYSFEDDNSCWCDSRCTGNDDCCNDFEEECSDYVETKEKKKRSSEDVETFVKEKMNYVSQACIRIDSDTGKVIYTDPFRTTDTHDADIILISHSHYDHYSVEDCQNIVNDDTVFVVPSSFSAEVEKSFPNHEVISVGSFDQKIVKGVSVGTIPAYNTKKDFHKKSENWVGFIIELEDGMKIYHAGDTNRIPEMKGLEVDVSLLPLGKTYTMESVDESVLAARDSGCSVAVPMHFGVYEGEDSDATVFEEGCREIGIDVVNLKDYITE